MVQRFLVCMLTTLHALHGVSFIVLG